MSKHLIATAIIALSLVAALPVFAGIQTVYGEGSNTVRAMARQMAETNARRNCSALNGTQTGPITILSEYQPGGGQFAPWMVRVALNCNVQ
jgi:hypothetical protein